MQVKQLIIFPILFTLAGCGATAAKYQPVVDRPNEKYATDLKQCQELAETRSYTNDDVKTEALAGAGIGALVGGLGDGWGGALRGALIGGTLVGGGKAWDTRDERKQIVIECLNGRGHSIAG